MLAKVYITMRRNKVKVRFFIEEKEAFSAPGETPAENTTLRFEDKLYKVTSVFRNYKYRALFRSVVCISTCVTLKEIKTN